MFNTKRWIIGALLLMLLALAACQPVAAPNTANTATDDTAVDDTAVDDTAADGDVTELRMVFYTDGNEDIVLRDLLDQFEAENPDIRVVMDVVAYTQILENLPLQLAAGEGPDMARVTDLGGLAEYYLELSPYLEDSAYWEESFGPFLEWMRLEGDDSGIYGFMTQLTVTGPYVNKTLFEQAGVELPNAEATWEDWHDATREVAEAVGLEHGMAMDRTGHRFAGPAISQGAQYFDEEGNPTLDDEGFRQMAQYLIDWHEDGTFDPEVWIGSTGYAAGNELFVNAQVPLYMSGSWQIGQFSDLIGDGFDWAAVPNPCGEAACTGMPGGSALVGIATTEHPEEVARVMEYLASTDVLRSFSEQTLFIPGHLGLSAEGVDFATDLPQASESLSVFVSEVGKLDSTAYDLQAYPFNRVIFDATRDRLSQVLVGELTLDEAMERIQDDIDTSIAEESS